MDAIYLDIAQALILITGGVVVFYALRSYRRTKSQAMLLLGFGFACVAAGAAVAGIIYNLNTADLGTPITVQAYTQALGFLAIVYSLAKAKS
jgi:hypothetical protein